MSKDAFISKRPEFYNIIQFIHYMSKSVWKPLSTLLVWGCFCWFEPCFKVLRKAFPDEHGFGMKRPTIMCGCNVRAPTWRDKSQFQTWRMCQCTSGLSCSCSRHVNNTGRQSSQDLDVCFRTFCGQKDAITGSPVGERSHILLTLLYFTFLLAYTFHGRTPPSEWHNLEKTSLSLFMNKHILSVV